MKEFTTEIVYNGIRFEVSGWYTPYRTGVAYAAPEDCYEPEGGIEEFEIMIDDESIMDMLTEETVTEIKDLVWKELQERE